MRAPLHARGIDGTNKHASAHSVRVRTCGSIIVHALEEAHRDALRCPFLLLRALQPLLLVPVGRAACSYGLCSKAFSRIESARLERVECHMLLNDKCKYGI